MLFHLSFHNKDQTKMFRGERGVGVNINFIQAVLTCIHRYRLEAV